MTLNVVAGVVQQQQIGQELSLGAGGSANRRLQSMMLEFGDELVVAKYRGQGRRHDNRVEPEQQWTSLGLTGHADYIEYLYAIEAAFGHVAPTQAGHQTASYTRTYDVPLTGKITPASITAQWGDTTNVNQVGYGILNDLGLKLTRKAAPAVNGAGIAQIKSTGGSFTASPTAQSIEPILASHVNYWLDTTGAGIGVTQVPQEFITCDWGYKGLYVPFWASNRSNTSFAGHLDAELSTEVKANFAESTLSRTVDAAMSTGTTYFLRIDLTGPLVNNLYIVSLGSPSAGTFTLTFNGVTTSGIAYNATAATVQAALVALSSVGAGNMLVTGSAGGPYTVQLVGTLAQSALALTGSGSGLTGGTFSITASPYYWQLWIDCALKLTKKDKWTLTGKDDPYMRGWTFEIVEDITWGHACMLTSITNLATL